MKPSVRFGLFLGAILFAIPLVIYALGMEKDDTLQKVSGFITVIICAIMIYAAIKETRDVIGNGFLTFGTGFKTGMITSAIGSAISGIGSYIYFSFINPGMITYIRMKQEEKLFEQGMDDAQVEKMASQMAAFSTPEMIAVFGFAGYMVLGLVISLICAGILKKENPSEMIS